jgi:hypothetical protein
MRKAFISVAVLAALGASAISSATALGHEFFGDSPFALEATSSATQIFQLGSSDSLECGKLALTYSPSSGALPNLALTIKSYEKCIFNHPFVSEKATLSTSGCEWVLKSFPLKEVSTKVFNEGAANLECTLVFTTTHCQVKILKRTLLSEFQWENLNTVFGSYKSELLFQLTSVGYEITGTGCTSSGSGGEYRGSIPLPGVIIK